MLGHEQNYCLNIGVYSALGQLYLTNQQILLPAPLHSFHTVSYARFQLGHQTNKGSKLPDLASVCFGCQNRKECRAIGWPASTNCYRLASSTGYTRAIFFNILRFEIPPASLVSRRLLNSRLCCYSKKPNFKNNLSNFQSRIFKTNRLVRCRCLLFMLLGLRQF